MFISIYYCVIIFIIVLIIVLIIVVIIIFSLLFSWLKSSLKTKTSATASQSTELKKQPFKNVSLGQLLCNLIFYFLEMQSFPKRADENFQEGIEKEDSELAVVIDPILKKREKKEEDRETSPFILLPLSSSSVSFLLQHRSRF